VRTQTSFGSRCTPSVKEVKGGTLGHKEDGFELQLALDCKVLLQEGLLPVICEALIKGIVLLLQGK